MNMYKGLETVAYLGVGHGAMFTSFRATINFFQHAIIYIAKIMALLHESQVKRKIRYFILYSHRDIELHDASYIDEYGPKNCRERF